MDGSNVGTSARTTVSCNGLTKSFNGDAVVHDLALDISEGSIVGLIGPSGSGKTTTVRLLVGLLEPTAGTATVWNTPSTELSAAQRQQIGYLPQIPALFPNLSLWENLSFHASMYGLRLRRRHRLHHVLEWVELDEHRKKKVRQVSGGMQRRLALAAALVHDPMLLFLDEPTAGIDPILRSTFWEHFREMRDEGRTICVTTQYVGEAAYCDYVGMLSDGELLLIDTPENLRKAAFEGEVVDIELTRPVEPHEIEQLAQLEGVLSRPEPLSPRTWRVVVEDADAAIDRLDDALERLQLPVLEAREHVVDFDEVFVKVIERHRAAGDRAARRGAAVSLRSRLSARRERRDEARRAKRARLQRGTKLRPSSGWATIVQALAFVRKELAEIVRQPMLLLLLVLGPFILLLLFGAGYKDTTIKLRTEFVGPEGSLYEDAISDYSDQLDEYIEVRGFTADEQAARRDLEQGRLDAVVVFPPDALDQILSGQSAKITVLHDTIDPFQQVAIDVSSRLAVQEVNALGARLDRRGDPGCDGTGRPDGERADGAGGHVDAGRGRRRRRDDRSGRRHRRRHGRRREGRGGDVAAGDRAARRHGGLAGDQ